MNVIPTHQIYFVKSLLREIKFFLLQKFEFSAHAQIQQFVSHN